MAHMTNDSERLLDDTGWELLCALQENARSSYAELGKRVGLTAPAVAERIRRMEVAGIITGYHAAVNPARLGLGLTSIMRFQSADRSEAGAIALMKSCPEIIECHRVTGDDCMTLTAVVASVEHLQALINKLASRGSSNTAIVLSSPIQHGVIGRQIFARTEEESA